TGGTVVTLATTDATTLKIPASITIPAGSTTANFTTAGGWVSSDQPVTMTAAFNGSSMSAAVTVQSGLAVAYAFYEGSGSGTVDVSGNGITGLIHGPTWTSGKYSNALSFNNSNKYVDLGNPKALQSTGSMSWSAWVYATANPVDDGNIASKSDWGAGLIGWQF